MQMRMLCPQAHQLPWDRPANPLLVFRIFRPCAAEVVDATAAQDLLDRLLRHGFPHLPARPSAAGLVDAPDACESPPVDGARSTAGAVDSDAQDLTVDTSSVNRLKPKLHDHHVSYIGVAFGLPHLSARPRAAEVVDALDASRAISVDKGCAGSTCPSSEDKLLVHHQAHAETEPPADVFIFGGAPQRGGLPAMPDTEHIKSILQDFLSLQDTVLNEGLEYIKRSVVECINLNFQALAQQIQHKPAVVEQHTHHSGPRMLSTEIAPEIVGCHENQIHDAGPPHDQVHHGQALWVPAAALARFFLRDNRANFEATCEQLDKLAELVGACDPSALETRLSHIEARVAELTKAAGNIETLAGQHEGLGEALAQHAQVLNDLCSSRTTATEGRTERMSVGLFRAFAEIKAEITVVKERLDLMRDVQLDAASSSQALPADALNDAIKRLELSLSGSLDEFAKYTELVVRRFQSTSDALGQFATLLAVQKVPDGSHGKRGRRGER